MVAERLLELPEVLNRVRSLPLRGLPLRVGDVSVPGEPGPVGLDVRTLQRVREGLRRCTGVRIPMPGSACALGDELDAHPVLTRIDSRGVRTGCACWRLYPKEVRRRGSPTGRYPA